VRLSIHSYSFYRLYGILRERVKAGIAHARKNGKPHGRPATAKALTGKIIKLSNECLNKSDIAKYEHE